MSTFAVVVVRKAEVAAPPPAPLLRRAGRAPGCGFAVARRRLRPSLRWHRATQPLAPLDAGDVAAASVVFGLHGLPLPPRRPLEAPPMPAKPANVTPKVLMDTYSVSGVKVSRSETNRQAVAEFQGQMMNSTDLSSFFDQYVENAKAGDEKVSKFVGDPGEGRGQTEASLDIQYIMGVAPHVHTQLWLFMQQDFCQDLKNWTDTMLARDDTALVHSVSYGWQGNLTQIQCEDSKIQTIDDNFAKLAAKGITVIFASGDSGSGYKPPETDCSPESLPLQNHTLLTGVARASSSTDTVW